MQYWDTTKPNGEEAADTIDNIIKYSMLQMIDRFKVEHNEPNSEREGQHIPGECSVVKVGTFEDIQLLPIKKGTIALDTATKYIYICNGTIWERTGIVDMESIGNGKAIYKGKSAQGVHQFKSIYASSGGEEGILINSNEDKISISANVLFLKSIRCEDIIDNLGNPLLYPYQFTVITDGISTPKIYYSWGNSWVLCTQEFIDAIVVDDTPYGSSWDGVITIAPSKNAIYDKIESIPPDAPLGSIGASSGGVPVYSGLVSGVQWIKQIASGSDKVVVNLHPLTGHITVDANSNNIVAGSTDSRLTDARTPLTHPHVATDITSGLLDGDRLPAISTTKNGAVPATGTPTGKYLKDDGTWTTVSTGGTIADGAVTNAKLANVPTNTVKGRVNLGTGVVSDILILPDLKTELGLNNVTNDAQLKLNSSDIANLEVKTSPVSTDILLIEDSANGYNKKKVTVGSLPSGGGGEANTASNPADGAIYNSVGMYWKKVGVDLQMMTLGTSIQTKRVVLYPNSQFGFVEIDVNEANLQHENIGGHGTKTHAEIDSYITKSTGTKNFFVPFMGLHDTVRGASIARVLPYPSNDTVYFSFGLPIDIDKSEPLLTVRLCYSIMTGYTNNISFNIRYKFQLKENFESPFINTLNVNMGDIFVSSSDIYIVSDTYVLLPIDFNPNQWDTRPRGQVSLELTMTMPIGISNPDSVNIYGIDVEYRTH